MPFGSTGFGWGEGKAFFMCTCFFLAGEAVPRPTVAHVANPVFRMISWISNRKVPDPHLSLVAVPFGSAGFGWGEGKAFFVFSVVSFAPSTDCVVTASWQTTQSPLWRSSRFLLRGFYPSPKRDPSNPIQPNRSDLASE